MGRQENNRRKSDRKVRKKKRMENGAGYKEPLYNISQRSYSLQEKNTNQSEQSKEVFPLFVIGKLNEWKSLELKVFVSMCRMIKIK